MEQNISQGISVIIPALNEGSSVADTIRRVNAVCKTIGKPYEVIVVDDGSTDDTGNAARSAGAVVLVNPANGGYGRSLRRGIEAARYSLIAITDADGTYPVEDLVRLYAEIEKGFDMAVGARQGRVYEGSMIKSSARKLFKLFAEYVAGRRIADINSGLRMFRTDLARKNLPQTCLGFSFTTSLTLIFMLQGHFVQYVPIVYHKRVGRTKVRHVRDAMRAMQIMTEVVARYNPLKLFLLFAVILGLAGILIAVVGLFVGKDFLVLAAGMFVSAAMIVIALGLVAQGNSSDRY